LLAIAALAAQMDMVSAMVPCKGEMAGRGVGTVGALLKEVLAAVAKSVALDDGPRVPQRRRLPVAA